MRHMYISRQRSITENQFFNTCIGLCQPCRKLLSSKNVSQFCKQVRTRKKGESTRTRQVKYLTRRAFPKQTRDHCVCIKDDIHAVVVLRVRRISCAISTSDKMGKSNAVRRSAAAKKFSTRRRRISSRKRRS